MPELDITADPLLVPAEQDTTTRTSTSGGRVMSPASKAAIDAEHAANIAVADAQKKVGEAQALQDTVRADQQANAADLARQQAADQAAEHQAQVDRVNAAREAAAAAEEAFANHTYHDYWSDKGVGKRLATAFGLFAGGTGAGLVGGDNPMQVALFRAMDRDFAKQTADLNRRRDVANMRRQDVSDLEIQNGHENGALAIKFAKANEATAAEMVQRLAEAGIPLDQAKNNVTVQGLLARAEEKRREALQHYDRTYQAATTKKEVTGASGAGSIAQQRLALQQQKLVVRDPNTGEPLGMAPTGEIAGKLGDTMSRLDTYQEAVNKLADHIEQHGHLLNPMSQEYKIRENLAADVQSMGRQIKGIQATDAGQKLEHLIIGGTGTGFNRSADPKVLRGLADQARKQTEQRLRSTLAPMPGQGASRSPTAGADEGEGAAPARAAGPSPARLALARKALSDPAAPIEVKRRAAQIFDEARRAGVR
jgi:hypothetical protein